MRPVKIPATKAAAGSEVMQSLVEAAGPAAAIKLVQSYGGMRLYIPLAISPEHEIAKLVGHENATRLARAIGGDRLDVPSANGPAYKALRDGEIRRMASEGVSGQKIAREMQITYMRVRQIATVGA